MIEDTETLAETISDVWQDGFAEMDDALREGFFDLVKGEWDDLGDHAMNVLYAIQDTLNATVYEMIKNWTKSKIKDIFGNMLGGSTEEDIVKKVSNEAKERTKLTAVLSGQTAAVKILNAAYQELLITLTALQAVGGGGSYGWGATGYVSFHRGGVAGIDSAPTRQMPTGLLLGAPRLHTGLMSDEYPAILRKNESVLTPGQMKALGGQTAQTTNTLSINVPVNVDANTKLASRLRTEVEELIKNVMDEEMR